MRACGKLVAAIVFVVTTGSLASTADAHPRFWRRGRVIVHHVVVVPDHRPPSGLMLGVHCYPTFDGLKVQDTIPGYCAEGRLREGDVLLRVRISQGPIYSVRTLGEIEDAKGQIGPGVWAVLQLFRPRVGTVCVWVRFSPLEASAAMTHLTEMMTEAERPGASAAFAEDEPSITVQRPGEEVANSLPGVADGRTDDTAANNELNGGSADMGRELRITSR